jgi:photosystem II stability/assembly factor-like uncharacterized protein
MKKNILLILFLLIYIPLYSQSYKWILVDSVIRGEATRLKYEAIKCFDSLNCIAAGNWNQSDPGVRLTTDGGLSWSQVLDDTTRYYYDSKGNKIITYKPAGLRNAVFPDSNNCILICDSGYYYHSTDFCKTWNRYQFPEKFWAHTIQFYNKNIGAIGVYRLIYLTTDGGETWETKYFDIPDSLQPMAFEDIFFPDSNTIICLVWKNNLNDYVIRSDDFGKTWQVYLNIPKRVGHIFFRDKYRGWAVGGTPLDPPSRYSQVILYTYDGGISWEVQLDSIPLIKPSYQLYRVYFYDDSLGIAIGYTQMTWLTTNGGKLWINDTNTYYPKMSDELIDVVYLTKTTLLGAGWLLGNIYKYTDEPLTVTEYNLSDGIIIYPNPASDEFRLKFHAPFETEVQLSVFDLLGNKVLSKIEQATEGTNENTINCETLPQGYYYVKININEIVETVPLVIIK